MEDIDPEDLPPDPQLLDAVYKNQTILTQEQKMDEDFNYLISFLPIMLPVMEDDTEKSLCEKWLEQLLGIRSTSLNEKRDRNLYIINLLLDMGNGRLRDPFNHLPPPVLKDGMHLFGGRLKTEVCYQDQNIEVEDFAEYSKDGRTFFAAKALPGGNGAFGYLGVSIGGGDALWLDCHGKYVDPRTITEQKSFGQETSETTQRFKTLKNVMSKRSPKREHSSLIPYYCELLNRVNKLIYCYEIGKEAADPVTDKLLQNLQLDLIHEKNLELTDLGCFGKLQWLNALKNKIKQKVLTVKEREDTLNDLEEIVAERENDEILFLDVTNSVKSSKLDPILAEAARDRPSVYHVTMLNRNYNKEILKQFFILLEKEKTEVVNQERLVYLNFVTRMRAEVLNEARRGLENYNDARREWQQLSQILKTVEATKNRLIQECERSTVTDDPDFHEKDNIINDELATAKIRLEEAQNQSDKVEDKINRIHEQVHQLTIEFNKMEEEGKKETEFLTSEIEELQAQIAIQERKIELLKDKLLEKQQREACSFQRS